MIIGLTGRKRSGKDTAAKVFIRSGYTHLKMADGLKAMLAAFLCYQGVDDETVYRMLEDDLKEVPTPFLGGRTPRYAMQTLGTEWGRAMMADDLWINGFKNCASRFDLVVCSDVRFPNEVEVIKEKGGVVYRITRPDAPANDAHESERFIDSLPVDGEIQNTANTAEAFQQIVLTMFQRAKAALQ